MTSSQRDISCHRTRVFIHLVLPAVLFGIFACQQMHSEELNWKNDPHAGVIRFGPCADYNNLDLLEAMHVYLNDHDLGSYHRAFKYLSAANLGPHDRVKIEIPESVNLCERSANPLGSALFIRTWLQRGVKLCFYQGNKAYKLHTFTWDHYKTDDGKWKLTAKERATVHMILDGHDIGEVGQETIDPREDTRLANFLKHFTWEQDMIFVIYEPYPDYVTFPEVPDEIPLHQFPDILLFNFILDYAQKNKRPFLKATPID